MPTPNSSLRVFKDVDELFDSIENEVILSWVNELAEVKARQRDMGRRYRMKQQIFAKLAQEHLDADEIRRVREEVAERVEEG